MVKNTIEVRLVQKGLLTGKVVARVEFSPEDKETKLKEAIEICEHWYNSALLGSRNRNDFLVISEDSSTVYYKAGPKAE